MGPCAGTLAVHGSHPARIGSAVSSADAAATASKGTCRPGSARGPGSRLDEPGTGRPRPGCRQPAHLEPCSLADTPTGFVWSCPHGQTSPLERRAARRPDLQRNADSQDLPLGAPRLRSASFRLPARPVPANRSIEGGRHQSQAVIHDRLFTDAARLCRIDHQARDAGRCLTPSAR